jgi:hypothetical protein
LLPTTLVSLTTAAPDVLARDLRAAPVPIVARVAAGAVLLDPRTVLPEDDGQLVLSVHHALTSLEDVDRRSVGDSSAV